MRLNIAKLPRSKWTASTPANKEKHFMVIALVEPEPAGAAVERILMEALHSGRRFEMPWRELHDAALWRQGWL